MILDAFVVGVTLHPLTVKQLNTKIIHFPGVNSLYSGSCSPKLEIRISFLNLDVITHIPCKKGYIYIYIFHLRCCEKNKWRQYNAKYANT